MHLSIVNGVVVDGRFLTYTGSTHETKKMYSKRLANKCADAYPNVVCLKPLIQARQYGFLEYPP
jgi:hypothetical protein